MNPTQDIRFGQLVYSPLTQFVISQQGKRGWAKKLDAELNNPYFAAPVIRNADDAGLDVYVQTTDKKKASVMLVPKGELPRYNPEDGSYGGTVASGEISDARGPQDAAALVSRVVGEYFRDQLSAEKTQRAQTETALEEARREVSVLSADKADLAEKLDETEARFAVELGDALAQNRVAADQIAALEAGQAEAGERQLELEAQLAAAREEADSQDEVVDSLKEQLRITEESLASYGDDLREARREGKEAEGKLGELCDQLKAMDAQSMELVSALADERAARIGAEQARDVVGAELATVNGALDELEADGFPVRDIIEAQNIDPQTAVEEATEDLFGGLVNGMFRDKPDDVDAKGDQPGDDPLADLGKNLKNMIRNWFN